MGESSGFETGILTTRDVYDFAVDTVEAREILQHRDSDLNLRGQTIFYVGSKNGWSRESPSFESEAFGWSTAT